MTVQYMGVNFADIYFRKGTYRTAEFPAIIGSEASGTIVSLPTDDAVLNDPEFKKRGFAVGGLVAAVKLGLYATYVSIPWKDAVAVPPPVSPLIAAAAIAQGLTAISFVEEAYNIQKGDIILVHTVAGGMGLLFAQLAKYRGATVIGTTSTKEKAELAKANGTDHVILYPVEDTVQRVLEITNGEGVHAVFDGVGKDTFDNNFKVIRRKGTIVSVGAASGALPPVDSSKLLEKNVKLLRPTLFNYIFTPEEVHHYGIELFDLIAKGILNIKIHKEYKFTAEDVQQSQKDLTGGHTTGKLVINAAAV